MGEKSTDKGEKGIYHVVSLLSFMLSLILFCSFSYAQKDSDYKDSFTLHGQVNHPAKEFSLKQQTRSIGYLSETKHRMVHARSIGEYKKTGTFHSSRMGEGMSEDSQMIVPVKPPLNQGKVAGEIVAGTLLGMAAGLGAAYLGASISYDGTWFSDLPGAIIGFTLAYPLGCALGVYTVGNIGSDTGSFSMAISAAYAGIFIGAISAYALSRVSSTALIIAFIAPAPLLATLAFNKSRRYKVPASNVALLNVRNGKMVVGFPAICVLPSASGSSKIDWLIDLFSVEF